MAKIIVDESELLGNGTVDALDRLARFFDRLDDPYRMPEAMIEYLAKQRETGVDTYYTAQVGYGPWAMSLSMTFKRDLLVMEFRSPDGMRLMELRLHV